MLFHKVRHSDLSLVVIHTIRIRYDAGGGFGSSNSHNFGSCLRNLDFALSKYDPVLVYTSYRQSILSLAQKTKLKHRAVAHPNKGSSGEELFTDYFYTEPQSKTLVHLSGLHGVEGYLGSLVQRKIFESLAELKPLPFQIIVVHAVNPYGMSWRRRANSRNVDLNRNSLKFYEIPNPHYEKFAPLINSNADGNSLSELFDAFMGFSQIGFQQMVQAIACGQTEFPNSLFYSGQELQPELISLKTTLQDLIAPKTEISVLDVHTGLGKYAKESLILGGPDSPEDERFVRTFFKSEPIIPGKSPGIYQAHGMISNLFQSTWGPDKVHYVCQEFGTRSVLRVFRALIKENYFHEWQPDLTLEEKKRAFEVISQRMIETFFPQDPSWRRYCVDTGMLRFQQLADGF